MPEAEGASGSLTGKLAAGAAVTVGAALGAVALSGKDSDKLDLEVCTWPRLSFAAKSSRK